jgi:hypothetical protein
MCYILGPHLGRAGEAPPKRICCLEKHVTFFLIYFVALIFRVHCWAFFRHIIFADGFLFTVKELWLLTNPGHWVRVLDVTSSYMYIVL